MNVAIVSSALDDPLKDEPTTVSALSQLVEYLSARPLTIDLRGVDAHELVDDSVLHTLPGDGQHDSLGLLRTLKQWLKKCLSVWVAFAPPQDQLEPETWTQLQRTCLDAARLVLQTNVLFATSSVSLGQLLCGKYPQPSATNHEGSLAVSHVDDSNDRPQFQQWCQTLAAALEEDLASFCSMQRKLRARRTNRQVPEHVARSYKAKLDRLHTVACFLKSYGFANWRLAVSTFQGTTLLSILAFLQVEAAWIEECARGTSSAVSATLSSNVSNSSVTTEVVAATFVEAFVAALECNPSVLWWHGVGGGALLDMYLHERRGIFHPLLRCAALVGHRASYPCQSAVMLLLLKPLVVRSAMCVERSAAVGGVLRILGGLCVCSNVMDDSSGLSCFAEWGARCRDLWTQLVAVCLQETALLAKCPDSGSLHVRCSLPQCAVAVARMTLFFMREQLHLLTSKLPPHDAAVALQRAADRTRDVSERAQAVTRSLLSVAHCGTQLRTSSHGQDMQSCERQSLVHVLQLSCALHSAVSNVCVSLAECASGTSGEAAYVFADLIQEHEALLVKSALLFTRLVEDGASSPLLVACLRAATSLLGFAKASDARSLVVEGALSLLEHSAALANRLWSSEELRLGFIVLILVKNIKYVSGSEHQV